MKPDNRLLKLLVEKLDNHRNSVPVFRIPERKLDELEETALRMVRSLVKHAGLREMRHSLQRTNNGTTIILQESGRVHVFHPSGATTFHRGWQPMEKIITPYAERADLKQLQSQAEEAAKRLDFVHLGKNERLQFERLRRLKAAGITRDGGRGQVALTRVVGAFRRYIEGIPVWGRASVFVQLAAEGQVASSGIDWRPILDEPIHTVKVISPEEAAGRILSVLQTFLLGRPHNAEDYMPEFFSLGYFSLPKRRAQSVMQPVFVAMMKPTGPIPSLGRLIVVPAGWHEYEPIARVFSAPPSTVKKPILRRAAS